MAAGREALPETNVNDTQVAPAVAEESTCIKCGCKIVDFDSHTFQCRLCWNVHQILYRHLGGSPPSLQSMQPSEQNKFFKEVGNKLKVTPKNARWSLVRAAMVTSITHYKREEQVNRVQRQYLPLSVLQTQGYDVEAIKQHGDRREDEVPVMHLFV